ncbi:MAG: hypothetical protein PHC28_12250 [Flavobacterium sp.]|uniref:hypothetical protein n=1 Tax=Flavobacterium sp. TaxID=239 RepID=UPI0026177253|nr:hypothetical protein [Flavobacterium sp.]MDD5151225.1 hypothetical protein [Flavobacterium sp.]
MSVRKLYRNNSCTRWTNYSLDGRPEKITLYTKSGKQIIRRVNFWQSFGNFATANITYKGKKINIFPDTILED